MRARKLILVLVALAVAALFFLNTWQGYRYERLAHQVAQLEQEQQEWLDRNKKAVIGIAILRSPERIERIARESLDMDKSGSAALTIVRIPQ